MLLPARREDLERMSPRWDVVGCDEPQGGYVYNAQPALHPFNVPGCRALAGQASKKRSVTKTSFQAIVLDEKL